MLARRLRLRHASTADRHWLAELLGRISQGFRPGIETRADGASCSAPPDRGRRPEEPTSGRPGRDVGPWAALAGAGHAEDVCEAIEGAGPNASRSRVTGAVTEKLRGQKAGRPDGDPLT